MMPELFQPSGLAERAETERGTVLRVSSPSPQEKPGKAFSIRHVLNAEGPVRKPVDRRNEFKKRVPHRKVGAALLNAL
jgi:hypothetical protein